MPLCPPLTCRGQWSAEAPAGAAAWRRPGCPGHLLLPASKVRWPGGECWHAGSCSLPAREAARSATHGLPAGRGLAVRWLVWVPAVLSCGCDCVLGRGHRLCVLIQVCTM